MKIRYDKRLLSYVPYLRENYYAKTAFSSATSLFVGFAFLIYNGVLGVMYGAVWNICGNVVCSTGETVVSWCVVHY